MGRGREGEEKGEREFYMIYSHIYILILAYIQIYVISFIKFFFWFI